MPVVSLSLCQGCLCLWLCDRFVCYHRYVFGDKDTLAGVALKFSMTLSQLRHLNRLPATALVLPGQVFPFFSSFSFSFSFLFFSFLPFHSIPLISFPFGDVFLFVKTLWVKNQTMEEEEDAQPNDFQKALQLSAEGLPERTYLLLLLLLLLFLLFLLFLFRLFLLLTSFFDGSGS